ncbi:MAG TPA: D-amino-acid transaminase [Xanthobacteraceae bacterium]|nr:D-amino-acid transaminase [Xanthobacteraceae bacterium]
MSRIAFVNGRYVPLREAAVHIDDRGYQFADAVYEVCEVREGRIVDERRHLQRLARSPGELAIPSPMSPRALGFVLRETVRRNRVRDGLLYLQVTRGVARREHAFPPVGTRPGLVVTARARDRAKAERVAEAGIAVITVADNRWERVDIKTTALVANVLARQAAREAGAGEAWFVDDAGFVTEGAASNAWIVSREGVLVTRPAERGILRGITRTVVCEIAAASGLKIEERPFRVSEALAAREAFITAATQIVMPVVKIDGSPIADGKPGPLSRSLRARFHEAAEIGD